MLLRPSRRKCLITFWVGIYFQTLFWTKVKYFLRAIRKRSANTSFSRLIKITFSFNFENLVKIFSKHRFVGFQFGREISKLRVIFFYSYWTRGIEHFLKKTIFFVHIRFFHSCDKGSCDCCEPRRGESRLYLSFWLCGIFIHKSSIFCITCRAVIPGFSAIILSRFSKKREKHNFCTNQWREKKEWEPIHNWLNNIPLQKNEKNLPGI